MSKANPNFIFLKDKVPKQRVTLLQGGTRSGKTFSTIYYFIWLCENYSGLEIDIVRDTFTALKSTVWKDFKEVLVKHNLYYKSNHNKTDHIYNLNGNMINYYGADDPQKIHGRKRDILWINESNQLTEETIDQLFPRTKHKIIMDYNPALPTEHWLDKYIDKYPPLITTYKDNPYLTKSQIIDIESKKDNPFWWCIYGTGERTKPIGVIFQNWEIGEFDDSLPYVYGMDFGYTNDPTTLIKVAKDKKNIYLHELCYETGMSTQNISDMLNKNININDTIIGDNSEPRLIDELQALGHSIYKCIKGKDSILNGISQMMDYKIIITSTSKNLIKEFNNYRWHDKINKPIDDYNHCIDASRYAFDELNGETEAFFV